MSYSILWMIILMDLQIFIHAGVPGIKLRTVDVEGEHQILPEYQAVVGRKAELPCNITVPSHNDKVSLILWYKGESRVPMYSVDARNSALDKAKHFPSEALGSRATFNMLTRPALLKIDPVQEDDSGEYRCRVDFRWARTYTTIALLNVIVPPKDITIIDEEGTEVSGVIGPYDEDSDLILRCEVSGGTPTPVVTWWREYTLLDDSYQVVGDGVVRNDVLIRGLQRSDLMTMLTCQTHNSNITAPIVASVTIDLNLKPLDVRITSIKRPFSAESKVEVVCISAGARPPARITWWKDNDQLMNSTERIPSSGNHTTSILTFWPSGDDNGKYLSCKADNPRLPDSTLEDGWMLNVSFAPRVILTSNGQTHRQAVMEKSDVYLHCEVRANPQVVTVQWLYEGRPIVNNLSQGVIITNQSLVLSKAQRFHRGRYQCLASNIEGQGKSEELFLEINYAPKCRNEQDNLYGAGRDELVRVKCEVEAEPPDVVFYWNFNNTAEKRNLSSFTVDGLQSVVTYIPRKLDDYGTLSCWSRNIAGQQEKPCLFTIISVGPPEKVRNCTITNVTSSSLLIECESGHDGGLQQRFHLEVYNSAKERLEANLTNSINPVFHVTSLPSSTSFVLISYASNLKGRSNSITLRAKTLVTYTKQSESFTSLPINPILGVLIGIVAALVFVAGIAVVIMKRRADDDDKGPLEDSAVEK
ncbi:synaptogenesis protein syg-2-like [Centruroides sculpturatus]|uniref:synaptogenesis protein syg-2-like n=1 Tax=Centruroides sculpturatus TaxID=218467 RepID=UPI000C6D0E32|nr:synaptogenesis protein syg-2-like [Centruroides sculpturatus]